MSRVRRAKLPLLVAAVGATLPSFGFGQTWSHQLNNTWTQSWNSNINWTPNTAFPNSPSAVATFSANTVAAGPGTVQLLTGVGISVAKINFVPAGTFNPISGLADSFTVTGPGTLTLSANGTIDVTAAGVAAIGVATIASNLFTPAGSMVTKTGSGALFLSGSNNFGSGSGFNGITIAGGTLVASGLNALNGLSAIATSGDGVLELRGASLSGAFAFGFPGSSTAQANGMIYSASGSNSFNGGWFVASQSTAGVAAGSTLTVNGSIEDGVDTLSNGFSKVGGDGLMIVNQFFLQGPLAVNAGTLRVKAGATPNLAAGQSTTSALSITGTGKLDLANNKLFVTYGANPTPAATIRSYLAAGRGSGNWQGATGIMSSGVFNAQHALGYRDNGSGTVTVMYTLTGDTDLDGAVGFSDLVPFGANYLDPGTWIWKDGDFNYDGLINFSDLVPFAANYTKNLTTFPAMPVSLSPEFLADWNLALTMVPEPASVGMLGLVAMGALGARRRRESRQQD